MTIDELAPPVTAPVPSRPAAAAARGRDRTLGVSLAALLLTFAAVVPLTRAISPAWLSLAIVCMVIVWLTGAVLRAARVPAAVVPLAQLIAWVAATTGCHTILALVGQLPGPYAWAGIVPTPRLLDALPGLATAAATEIVESAAPFPPGPALVLVLVAAAGLLATVSDVLAVTLRAPLAAIVVALAAWVVPPAVTGMAVQLPSIIVVVAAALLLLALDRRRRAPEEFRAIPAAAVAAVALVVALVVAPALPEPSASLRGPGPPTSIDATLNLGDDLRRSGDAEVLRYTVTAGEPPYLRVATLSSFDGGRWHPDLGMTVPLDGGYPPEGEAPRAVPEGVATTEVSVQVQVMNLEGGYLPVPAPLSALRGTGDGWEVLSENLTVIGGEVSGESYTATALVPRPTREQARAATARIASPSAEGIDNTTVALPGSPAIRAIRETAEEVTAGAETDYDRLIALQSWFRGGAFRYSLDAPVADGFDGTGLEAMLQFLEVRSGYCVHYASTFAVMARALGMPARVVVGYLPGTHDGDDDEGRSVYSVRASQLHAWPEVYLSGIGWVPFEPTPSLGIATAFLPAALTPQGDDPNGPLPDASATPSAAPAPGASRPAEDVTGAPAGSGRDDDVARLIALGAAAGVIALAAAPGIVRHAIRRTRMRRAARGDARAAWRELRATLVDAGIETPPHESPRVLAARLRGTYGVPDATLAPLVAAIEARSYGPDDAAGAGDLAVPLRRLRVQVAASRARRAAALIAPRSLLTPPRFGGPDGDG